MFSPATTMIVYQTSSSKEVLTTVHITNVDQVNPQDVHLVRAFFMLFQDHMGNIVRETGFEWQGNSVFNGMVVKTDSLSLVKSNIDTVFDNIVASANKLGVSTVTRVII